MYKFEHYRQLGLADFIRSLGFKMNPESRWVKKAAAIPWDAIEKIRRAFSGQNRYAGSIAPYGTWITYDSETVKLPDRKLVEQITENPYYQFFVGLLGFCNELSYVPSLLVEFRKRLDDEILSEINEIITDYNRLNDQGSSSGTDVTEEASAKTENSGTIILDVTCAPQNISCPQDANLPNEARENMKGMIDQICYDYNYYKSRMHREKTRKDYLNLARCKKRTAKKIRKAIKQQLQYIRRDRVYINVFLEAGVELIPKQVVRLKVIV